MNFSFEPTPQCIANCVHCPRDRLVRHSPAMLSFAEFVCLSEKMLELKPEFIGFAGMGEPLLHPELEKMIACVSEETTTFITTNAQILSELKTAKLLRAGLGYAVVSVHTCRSELYEQLMVGCSYQRMVERVKIAIGMGLDIKMQVIVSEATKDHLGQTWQLAKDLGCSEVYWALLHNRGGHLAASTRPIPGDINRCDIFNNTMFIDCDGIIRSCSNDIGNETNYGTNITAAVAQRTTLPEMCSRCNDSMRDLSTVHSDLRAAGVKQEWIGPIQ